MNLNMKLNLLTEQQNEMKKQGNLRAYKGLLMQEAAILRERGKKETDPIAAEILLSAGKEAMILAIEVGTIINKPVQSNTQDAQA